MLLCRGLGISGTTAHAAGHDPGTSEPLHSTSWAQLSLGPPVCLWELESLLSLPYPLPSSAGCEGQMPADILPFWLSGLSMPFFLPLLSLIKDSIIL